MTAVNNNNAFLILAAGKGTRMKNHLPKVLHKICGKEMVRYVHELASSFNSDKIGIIASDDAAETIEFAKKELPNSTIIKQNERLGTGHAVKVSLDFLKGFNGNVICLYGDTPFISKQSVTDLTNSLNGEENTAVSVLGFRPKDAAKYGRLKLNNKGDLVEIIEFNDANDIEKSIGFCNSGVVAIKGKYLEDLINNINNQNAKGEYYLTDIVKIAVNKGLNCTTVEAEEHEVMGINSQIERADAEKIRQNYLRNKFLESGVILYSPETVYFSEDTNLEAGVEVEPNVHFYGNVNVKKGANIRAFSYLEDCNIEENCVVGPYARIRPKTNLEKGAKVGNFVEIKKSNIGEGSKVNHLTYIGDSTLGKNVNIGAGTVTCNYDGKNKFSTNIGDNSFVGSNTSIVAPINIGSNAVIGAATTVLKDVGENKKIINTKSQKELD